MCFVGACNFFRRHIHNFTYSSASLTDLIKKTTPWRWTAREEEWFQELKKKIASSNCLGVPRAEGEIVLITDGSHVGGGGTIYQWQELNPAELTHCHYRTSGLNRDGSLKHDYPTSEWRLVPLGHRNWKWNQGRSNYSTYDLELLPGMLVLSSQSRLLGSNPIVWLCDQDPVKSFQKGPPPEKAKLKRWWTYLSQFRLTVHHIPGIKNELSDYISRNNFDALIGESSEALAREAFQCMDVQLDLSMRTAGILEGWSLTDYQSEYEEIVQTLSTGLEPRVIDGHQWYKNNQYLFYEDRIVVPEARLDGCLQWSHLSSGHTGANRSVDFFRECFYSSLTLTELRSRMQTIVDACGCHASRQSGSRDRGLISSLPIPYCANSLLYVDFIHGLPRFGGYDSCLVVTSGLSPFTRVFPCNKKITGEQTVKMLVEQWFEPYGAPKQVHSDEDVRIRSDTGWYKRVLNALNVEVTTGVPYTHTSNPLCERQNRVVEQNLTFLMKQERTKDLVRPVPWAVLTMNSQRSSSTGFTPHELFHGGRPAWFFKTPFLKDFKSPVGDWLEHKQSLANQAGANLRHIRDRELSRRNRLRRPASFKVGDLVFVHQSRLPSWPRNCLQDPYFGPYRIIRIDGSRIHVRCSPRLRGEPLGAPKQLRHYHSPDDLSWSEWRLSDSEDERIDLENAASPEEADELEEMIADEMAVDGYYVVAGIARHEYKQGWKFLTLWDGYGLSEATWEPMSAFIQPDGSINPIFRTYLVENNEGQLLTRAETMSQRRKRN